MTWQVFCGHLWSYCLEIRSHISTGKGQQAMEHNSFPLEFHLLDGKDAFQTAQKCYQLKIRSSCKCHLQYICCLHRHLYHDWNTLLLFDMCIYYIYVYMCISYTPIFVPMIPCRAANTLSANFHNNCDKTFSLFFIHSLTPPPFLSPPLVLPDVVVDTVGPPNKDSIKNPIATPTSVYMNNIIIPCSLERVLILSPSVPVSLSKNFVIDPLIWLIFLEASPFKISICSFLSFSWSVSFSIFNPFSLIIWVSWILYFI